MNAEDLAFYLATHNFDAKPNGGHVDVNLDGSICKLTPNGSAPGLCSIETPMSPGRGSHVTDGKPHIVIRSR
jgi:hypothetical protein